MKFLVLINQRAAHKLGLIGKVDAGDLAVLAYLFGWVRNTKSKRIEVDGQDYVWLKYSHAVKEMPLVFNPNADIRSRKNQLVRIVRKLRIVGLVVTHQSGSRLYFCPTPLADELEVKRRSSPITSPRDGAVTSARDRSVTSARDDSQLGYSTGNSNQGNDYQETPPVVPQGGTRVDAVAQPSNQQISDAAEEIYAAYPKKAAKPLARRAIQRALKKHPAAYLLERTRRYAAVYQGDPQYIPNPATWFNQERFLDDETTWTRSSSSAVRPRAAAPARTFAHLDYSSPP